MSYFIYSDLVAQRRGGAEKTKSNASIRALEFAAKQGGFLEKNCFVFSASLRLCASNSSEMKLVQTSLPSPRRCRGSGQAFVSAYSAAKFGLEGWMESLASEIAPFGIRTMLVEPGFFRTELLTDESTKWPEPTIEDYAENTRQTISAWKKMNGLHCHHDIARNDFASIKKQRYDKKHEKTLHCPVFTLKMAVCATL